MNKGPLISACLEITILNCFKRTFQYWNIFLEKNTLQYFYSEKLLLETVQRLSKHALSSSE